MRGRKRKRIIVGLLGVCAAALFVARRTTMQQVTPVWTVDRGDVVVELIQPGTLRAAGSTTYRSPVNGREVEIVYLVPEGQRVTEGDLLSRLETRDLEADLRQAVDGLHDVEFARQVAELELLEATAGYDSTVDGEDALSVEEGRTAVALAEGKVDRLRREVQNLRPLLEQGFITGDEFERAQAELEAGEAELVIARRRARVMVDQTHPLNRRRAELQLAQKRAQRDVVDRRLAAARRRVEEIADLIEQCSIYADAPGLVVYEEFMGSSPRRKVRLGDRVTPSQGIARVVEVNRMLVATSVPERAVHRVRMGQPVRVHVEAFPELQLSGRVTTIGVLARTTQYQAAEAKRFDVIVELDPTDVELRPEMTARVDIRVGERHDVVRLPVDAVFERDGMIMVNVQGVGGGEARPLELGEQNERFVEVVAGVDEGDRVMLVGSPGRNEADSPAIGDVEMAGIDSDRRNGTDGYLGMGPTR